MVHTKSKSDCLMDCSPAIVEKESFLEGIHKHCCNILASDLVRDNKIRSTELDISLLLLLLLLLLLKGIPDANSVDARACHVDVCSNKSVPSPRACVSLGSRLAIICSTCSGLNTWGDDDESEDISSKTSFAALATASSR